MKCPVCKDVSLVLSDRQGVEIDYCPSCRGVWLDRGELDKIIDRNSSSFSNSQPAQKPYRQENNHHDSYNHHQNSGYHNNSHHKNKKSSFLSDIFDF